MDWSLGGMAWIKQALNHHLKVGQTKSLQTSNEQTTDNGGLGKGSR